MTTSRAARVIGAVVVLSSALAVAEARSGNGTTVNVSELEMKVTASRASVPAGPVTFLVRNLGTVDHELVVVRWAGKPAAVPQKSFKASESTAIGEVPELAPNKTARVTLNLAPGRYVLICNIPGHYQLGMRTTLTVT